MKKTILHCETIAGLFVWLAVLAPAGADDNTSLIFNGTTTNIGADLTIGATGTNNSLQILNAGSVTNVEGKIGSGVNANYNFAIITNSGSLWYNSSFFRPGFFGDSNQVIIADGGMVSAVGTLLGDQSSAQYNTMLVTGNGVLTNSSTFWIGNAGGHSQLTISQGGKVYNNASVMANAAGSVENSVLLTGPTSLWASGSDVQAGSAAGSTLNSILVTDGALLTSAGTVFSGVGGHHNQITVTNGGRVLVGQMLLGNSASGSNNTVLITGAGSIWSNSLAVFVGNGGSYNDLTVTSSAKLYSASAVIGNTATANSNTVLITGNTTLWKNNGDLSIGSSGGGNRLTVDNGAQLLSAAYVGFSSAGNQLIVTNGSQVIGGGSVISYQPVASDNTAVITGVGSLWSNTVFLYVGFNGRNANLTIANGGQVVNPSGIVGGLSTSSNNTVLITGAGSLWRNTDLYVGTNATSKGTGAQILVTDGGTLESFNWTGGLNNSATISNRQGIYQFPTATPNITPNTAGSFVITNGTISYRGVTAANIYNGQVANIAFQGNNTFQLNNATNASVASYAFDSVGNTGTATNYQRLALANGSRWQSTTLAIGSGGALIGNGTVASANVTNQGTIAPGFSAGSLTFTSNLVLGASSRLEMEIGGAALSNYDQLVVAGNVAVTGALAITTINAFGPTPGQTFTLIDNQGANPISGLFDGLTNNAFIDASANGMDAFFRIQYDGGTGNDLVLVATVPEPSALFLSFAALLVLRRRYRG